MFRTSRSGFRLGMAAAAGLGLTLPVARELRPQCAPVTFILQDEPVAARPHTTSELHAHEVSAVKRAIPPGEAGSVALYAGIVSDLGDEVAGGIQGWSLGLGTLPGDGVLITAWSEEETVLARPPEGLWEGFRKTQIYDPARHPCFSSAVVSGALLSLVVPATTLPRRGTATVLAITVQAAAPQGIEPQRGTVDWLVGGGLQSPCPFAGAGGGSVAPAELSVLNIDGELTPACENRPASVAFVIAGFAMLRGDVNSDGRVDISDAIRTFMYLFLGGKEPSCVDTADTNDSGLVDISDGILILNDFFRADTGISAPGPVDCGPDPTPDGLTCRSYPPCE